MLFLDKHGNGTTYFTSEFKLLLRFLYQILEMVVLTTTELCT